MIERKRNRLIGFDYSTENLYFVTSCTKDRLHFFGEIVNGIMILNDMGEIAQQQWNWLTEQYAYIKSHAFVVMPNHIHGVLEITHDTNPPKIKSLSELMGAYKTTTSKKIHQLGHVDFAWQRSFHDNIIRNHSALENIIRYIENNPLLWEKDDFNQDIKQEK